MNPVADAFTEQVVAKTKAWSYGDPADAKVDMGTVIDEPGGTPVLRVVSTKPWRRARGCWWQ